PARYGSEGAAARRPAGGTLERTRHASLAGRSRCSIFHRPVRTLIIPRFKTPLMSTSPARGAITLTEDDIAGWLRVHPDFFQRNGELLATLRVPHATGGAVSLIERQIELLREKNQNADARFNELVQIARANEQLTAKIHRFTRRLMRAATRRAIH